LLAADADVVTPPTLIEGDGAPYRMMLAKGPNEEMFEFIQLGAGPVAARVAKRPAKKTPATGKPKAKTKVKPKVVAKAKPRPVARPKAKLKSKPKPKARKKR
jgi:hypothetical protein